MADKREDYISWNEYFMGIAYLSAMRSKDPNTQVGCCIVDKNNRILSASYNGFPNGVDDNNMSFSWKREGDTLSTKYPFVTHADLNAIINSKTSLDGASLYVTLFPCNECAKAIIQSGIKKIYYYDDKYDGSESNIASKKMFDASNVEYIKIDEPHLRIN